MNPNRMANHRRGEKAKLLSATKELCVLLNRPICSGDLSDFFRENPERRPCLLKRLGQQLIVAAEAQDGVVPHLKRIGIFRHKAYYAIDDTPTWRRHFSDHCVEEQIAELLRLNIPDHVLTLSELGLTDLSGHAASGWLGEITALAKGHSNPGRARATAHADVELILPYARPPFVRPVNWPLIGRDEATRFIMEEADARRLWDAPLSPFRYLVRFRWPQSVIFPAQSKYRASPAQLFHFVRGKWPMGDEDDAMHRAIAECLRYGAPVGFVDSGYRTI